MFTFILLQEEASLTLNEAMVIKKTDEEIIQMQKRIHLQHLQFYLLKKIVRNYKFSRFLSFVFYLQFHLLLLTCITWFSGFIFLL